MSSKKGAEGKVPALSIIEQLRHVAVRTVACASNGSSFVVLLRSGHVVAFGRLRRLYMRF